MTSRVLERWLMPRWFALFLVAAACTTALPPHATLAQPSQVTIRGFRFDPADVQDASAEYLRDLGIEDGLQARAPARNDGPHWRLLQFSRPIDRETRRDLLARGLELQRYFAGMYLERVTLDTVEALRASGVLRASVLYHPAFKLSPSIRGARLQETRTFQTEQRRRLPGLVLRATTFPTATDLEAVARQIRGVDSDVIMDVFVQDNRRVGGPGRVIFRLAGTADQTARALTTVARIDEIESIEEVGEIIPDSAAAASVNQSGNPAQPTIWNRGLAGEGQAIGIFDFGIADTDHCFFRDPATANNTPGPGHRKLLEIRNQSQFSEEGPEHPTYVAAIAAGDDFNAPPAHDAERGGAWAAKLVLANVFDFYEVKSGQTVLNAPPSTLPIELDAVAQKAYITSYSWHKDEEYSATAVDFDSFARMHEDHVVVASAGTTNSTKWGPPSIAKNSIAVSAASLTTTQIMDGYKMNPLSGQQKPDLAAVGCGIVTAAPTVSGNSCGTVALGVCATSYAAPEAAAIAALARQYYVDGRYDGVARQPTGSLVKATLINSARDVTGQPNFPSVREGWGIVTLDRTLTFSDSDRVLWIEDVRNTDPKRSKPATSATIPSRCRRARSR
jgi:subtilase family protein